MFKLLVAVFLLASLAVTPSVSWDRRCPPIEDFIGKSPYALYRTDVENYGAYMACSTCHRMVCTLEQLKKAYYEKHYGSDGLIWYNPDPNTSGLKNLALANVNACTTLTMWPCEFDINGVRAVQLFPGDHSNHAYALCCSKPDSDSDQRSYMLE